MPYQRLAGFRKGVANGGADQHHFHRKGKILNIAYATLSPVEGAIV